MAIYLAWTHILCFHKNILAIGWVIIHLIKLINNKSYTGTKSHYSITHKAFSQPLGAHKLNRDWKHAKSPQWCNRKPTQRIYHSLRKQNILICWFNMLMLIIKAWYSVKK